MGAGRERISSCRHGVNRYFHSVSRETKGRGITLTPFPLLLFVFEPFAAAINREPERLFSAIAAVICNPFLGEANHGGIDEFRLAAAIASGNFIGAENQGGLHFHIPMFQMVRVIPSLSMIPLCHATHRISSKKCSLVELFCESLLMKAAKNISVDI